MLHCEENTGYAIVSLERVFLEAALAAGYSLTNIHYSYKSLDTEPSTSLPEGFTNKMRLDFKNIDDQDSKYLSEYVTQHNIDTVLAFDLGLESGVSKILLEAGVTKLISYWGAPMSAPCGGLKLLLKKLDVFLHRHKPTHFIFESQAMAMSATHGRGISARAVDIIYLGVDSEKYHPSCSSPDYAHDTLNIPKNRKLIFYSGHMEERKGVAVIIKAAMTLINEQNIQNIHFVLCGNKGNEADRFIELYQGTEAENHITFGGYRNDIPELMSSSTMGVIASTGWDSFTMSSVEMASCGLPIAVSRLHGLIETVEEGKTGYTFEVGNHMALASCILNITQNEQLRDRLSVAARSRALTNHNRKNQISQLANLIQRSN